MAGRRSLQSSSISQLTLQPETIPSCYRRSRHAEFQPLSGRHAGIQVAICPLCGSRSRRVHSRYVREVSDLPCSGRNVRLRIMARRFCCSIPHCRRRIFAERFDKTVLLVRSRRTSPLDCVVHHLGLALGGRPAANFAKRLMLPISNDAVLRVVRAQARPRTEPLNVVGIDDWAFRRDHSYGTIVCDLERRRIVTLLPDREMATVEAWLAGHPDIRVLSRDRGGEYAEAASKALPWCRSGCGSLASYGNASAAFLGAVRKSMRPICAPIHPETTDLRGTTAIRRLPAAGGDHCHHLGAR
jgi:transposase